jgi:anti-sigma factor RsiW
MTDLRESGSGAGHEQWLLQIDAELDGELSLIERAALAKHLATCAHCAGARASQLEVRVALARSAGNPHAFVVPRPSIRGGTLARWVFVALLAGALGGWLAYGRWGGPGSRGTLEDTRAAIVVQ